MSKKIFIVPNNDAEAIRIQKLINENNTCEYEMIITGQDWRCFLWWSRARYTKKNIRSTTKWHRNLYDRAKRCTK